MEYHRAMEKLTFRSKIGYASAAFGDAAAYARTVVQEGIHPDVICVDPPRKGCAKSVLEDIVRMAPKRIVYVSCDPGSRWTCFRRPIRSNPWRSS